MKLPEKPRPEYKESKAKPKAPATVGLIEHWRKLESEGKTRGRIENMLDKINFEGADKPSKKIFTKKMMELIKKYKMDSKEADKFISTVEKQLNKLNVYIEQNPLEEIGQGLVSLVSTGRTDHFFTHVPNEKAKEKLQSLPDTAAKIVKERKK